MSATPRPRRFARSTASPARQGMVNLEGIRFCPRAGRRRRCSSSCIRRRPCSSCRCRGRWRTSGVHVLCAASRYCTQRHAADHGEGACSTSAPISATPGGLGLRQDRAGRLVAAAARSPCSTSRRRSSRPSPHTPAGDPIDIDGAGLIAGRRDDLPGRARLARRAARRLDRSLGARRERPRRPRSSSSTSTTRAIRTGRPIRPTSSRASAPRSWRACAGARRGSRRCWRRLRARGGETERGFVTHRTHRRPALPRPDDRSQRPQAALVLARRSGNREHRRRSASRASRRCAPGSRNGRSTTRARTARAARRTSPCRCLAIENTADDAVPQPHTGKIFAAAASKDKTMKVDQGRHPLLRRPARAARRGGAGLPRLAGRARAARLAPSPACG